MPFLPVAWLLAGEIARHSQTRIRSQQAYTPPRHRNWLPPPRPLPPPPLQVADDSPVMLNGFGTVVNGLGKRSRPYLPQICGTIKWRLNNKSAKIRQQAADLIARIAPVMKACDEEGLLGHLGGWGLGSGAVSEARVRGGSLPVPSRQRQQRYHGMQSYCAALPRRLKAPPAYLPAT